MPCSISITNLSSGMKIGTTFQLEFDYSNDKPSNCPVTAMCTLAPPSKTSVPKGSGSSSVMIYHDSGDDQPHTLTISMSYQGQQVAADTVSDFFVE